MTVQENIERKETALNELKSHCLFFKQEGNIVYLPDGYYPNGIRIKETAQGYEQATQYLESVWKNSLIMFDLS